MVAEKKFGLPENVSEGKDKTIIDDKTRKMMLESAKKAQLREQRRTGTHPEVKNQR